MKHRFYCVLICCALFFAITISAYAAETTEYTLSELGMTVSMPSDHIVFTRDIDANDPNLAAYGITKDSILSLMNEQNIYLDGWDEYINQEIVITMLESTLTDFNLYGDTTLTTMAKFFESEYESFGITASKSEIYKHSQAKFVKVYISQPNGDSTSYGLQYYTAYADKAINITLHSNSGQITSEQEATLKSIVDSVTFDTEPQTIETEFTPTPSFTYTDTETQATFTVPANWAEEALSKERIYIDKKFVSNMDLGLSIVYGSFDAYEEYPELKEMGMPRSKINMELLSTQLSEAETEELFAEMYGDITSDIVSAKYGDNSYYVMQITDTTEVAGLELESKITQALCVENGYFYLFMFSGTSDNALFSDFESLLSSVKFASINDSVTISNLFNRFSFENILLSLLLTIAVYSLPIIIYRYAIKKAPVAARKAKKITIIYGACAFIVMSVIIFSITRNGFTGGAILLWSYVNYRILIGGKTSDINPPGTSSEDAGAVVFESSGSPENSVPINFGYVPDSSPEIEESQKNREISEAANDSGPEPSAAEIRYCRKCGNRLPEAALFCNKCGTKIIRD